MAEEKKKKYRFFLRCTKCGFKFSIERDYSDMNKVRIDKMKCMECGSPIQWDTTNFPVSSKPSLEAQGKTNIEMTRVALELAAKQKAMDEAIGGREMVPVTSTQKGKNKGKTEMLPKRVIESIKEKVSPILQEED